MKEILKKITMVLMITAAISIVPAAMSAPAVTTTVFAVPSGNEGEAVPTPIQASAGTQATSTLALNNQANTAERSGMSIGGVIVLILFTVVINAVISFIISNRFYKMSKRDSHLQAEIRALRRDIDDRFSGRITELHERSVNVNNTNKSYSRGDEAITYKEDTSDTVAEIAKRWNIQIEDETEPKVRFKSSKGSERASRADRPRQSKNTARSRDVDADEGVSDNVKSKAKKFLGDIFPFEED